MAALLPDPEPAVGLIDHDVIVITVDAAARCPPSVFSLLPLCQGQ